MKRRDIDGEEGRKDIDWTKGGRKEKCDPFGGLKGGGGRKQKGD